MENIAAPMVASVRSMFVNRKTIMAAFCLMLCGQTAWSTDGATSRHPFYFGVNTGYGSTTWGELVPPPDEENLAMEMSTPTSVSEGGAMWGFFAGYEFVPQFAVEAAWTRYPVAHVVFDETSLFALDHDGLTWFDTNTSSVSLSGKLIIDFPNTPVRVFSAVGAAGLHRTDMITDRWRVSPTFSVGVSYPFTEHLFAEVGVNYTGGYGQSEINPAEDYVPFLYDGFLHIGWRV